MKNWMWLATIGMGTLLGCAKPSDQAARDTAPAGTARDDDRAVGYQPPDTQDVVRDKDPGDDDAVPVSLTIGDPAPPLQIQEWVKGSEVASFEPEKIYVVEFWATWCGPCKLSMPHLSELQGRFADDVTFIGVSQEKVDTVKAFFEREFDKDRTWSDIVKYTIGVDDHGTTTESYYEASGQAGIPVAFVVGRDQHLEWIGHPMGLEADLEAIIAGTWDREAAKVKYEEEREFQEALMAAITQIRAAFAKNDNDEALRVMSELSERFPDNDEVTYMMIDLLIKAGRAEDGREAADKLARKHWDNASLLNNLAWNLAVSGKEKVYPTALEIAERANEVSEGKDHSVLETLARAHYEMGHLQQAVDIQQKAVDLGGDDSEILEQTLKEYRDKLNPPPVDEPEESEATAAEDEDEPAPEEAAPDEEEIAPDEAAPEDTTDEEPDA